MIIENRAYNLTADALNQMMSLSELYTRRVRVSSVDLILQENGLTVPTINYSLQRDNLYNTDLEDTSDQIKF